MSVDPETWEHFMLSFPFANLQVVERERVDSKAEQEKLNMNIQEFLKEMEVLCWAWQFSVLTNLHFCRSKCSSH